MSDHQKRQDCAVSRRDFLNIAAEPGFAAKIYEDERNFADQSVMRGGFLRLNQ